MRVLVAGGGVAGLEATLALGELAGDLVEVELLSPGEEFVYRPMLVAEPFGTARALRVEIDAILGDARVEHRRDALAAVDPAARQVTTTGGQTIDYDALLIALGARPVDAVPGALTFDDRSETTALERLLRTLGSRHLRRIAFVVPHQPTWTIAAYELALMTARERDARRIPRLEISVVTAEFTPLGMFGVAASQLVAETLERAGVGLRTSARARRFADGRLELEGDESLAVDAAVALPALTVPEIPGLPQRANGFLGTDVAMKVDGMESVWAAGDATHFPVKQGGIASQQADVAARAIAVRAGGRIGLEPFRPVLRGALITGEAPEFLEAELSDPGAGVASVGAPLWTPSLKLAAKYLSPRIARALRGGGPPPAFADLPPQGDAEAPGQAHERAVAVVLAAADDDAARGDHEGALRWLSFVEQLELAIPADYVARRERWRRELDPDAAAHPAARRIDPSFATSDEAISDLRRRIGWLREAEARGGEEMASGIARIEAGIDAVVRLSRSSGTLTPRARG